MEEPALMQGQQERMEVKEVLDMVSQTAKAPQSRVLASIENDSSKRFISQFPITSLEDFHQLEDSLKDEETSKLMECWLQPTARLLQTKYMKHVCGNGFDRLDQNCQQIQKKFYV